MKCLLCSDQRIIWTKAPGIARCEPCPNCNKKVTDKNQLKKNKAVQ